MNGVAETDARALAATEMGNYLSFDEKAARSRLRAEAKRRAREELDKATDPVGSYYAAKTHLSRANTTYAFAPLAAKTQTMKAENDRTGHFEA
jgi:hypothetical protein